MNTILRNLLIVLKCIHVLIFIMSSCIHLHVLIGHECPHIYSGSHKNMRTYVFIFPFLKFFLKRKLCEDIYIRALLARCHVITSRNACREYVCYGVATTSRLPKSTCLFCRIQSLLQGSFAKETYNLKAPTHRSHPTYVEDTRARNVAWHTHYQYSSGYPLSVCIGIPTTSFQSKLYSRYIS